MFCYFDDDRPNEVCILYVSRYCYILYLLMFMIQYKIPEPQNNVEINVILKFFGLFLSSLIKSVIGLLKVNHSSHRMSQTTSKEKELSLKNKLTNYLNNLFN